MTHPNTPKLLKGAIVSFDLFNPVASVVVFQYNPEQVTRTLQMQASGEDGDRSEVLRIKGAPVENIKMEVEIDATDQLETAKASATILGVHPQLAALELMLYPKSVLVTANTVLLAAGTIEITPPIAPFTLLVWGLKRILPVRLNEFSITEGFFDPALNPTQAKVSLGFRVLSYNDFSVKDPGHYLFLTHQIAKEAFATVGSFGNLGAVFGADAKLIEPQL